MINLRCVPITAPEQQIVNHHVLVRQTPQLSCHGKLAAISRREQVVSACVVAVLAPAAERQMYQQQKDQERSYNYEVGSKHLVIALLRMIATHMKFYMVFLYHISVCSCSNSHHNSRISKFRTPLSYADQ